MLLRILTSIRSYSQIKMAKNNAVNMQKCYFRFTQAEDQVNITFLLKINEASQRQFNFIRKSSETVESLATRIATNVSKVLNKKNKKKNQARTENSELEIRFFESGAAVPRDVVCNDLLSKAKDLKIRVSDQEFEVVVNAPWVLNITLPQSILSGFPVYPDHFEIQFAKKEHCKFTWYTGQTINNKGNKIMDDNIKWQICGNSYSYTPLPQDIGLRLKIECTPGNELMQGPAVETVSDECVEAGPGRCPFENRHAFTQNKLMGSSFRVVSYNILADLYCDSEFTRTSLHPYCPPYALHIDYRKQLILKELLGYNADIACLQEVDRKIFNHVLQPILEVESLQGVFTKKGKEVAEGLACFFKKDRFKLLSKEEIVLAEHLSTLPCFKLIWDKIKGNTLLVQRVLDRTTAAQATVLQSIDNENNIVVVGNTHLYFHPDADHIRLLQGGMVIYWLRNIIDTLKTKYTNARISLIVCGDFNSVPSCGIYKLYTGGEAPCTLEDWKSKEDEAVVGLSLQQDIPLDSACGTPEYTNFTAGFADCLDYIFYDTRSMAVEQVIPFPSAEELREHTALPSVVFPSDHVAVVADLRFK